MAYMMMMGSYEIGQFSWSCFFSAAKSVAKLCSLFTAIRVVHRTEDKMLISDKLNRT